MKLLNRHWIWSCVLTVLVACQAPSHDEKDSLRNKKECPKISSTEPVLIPAGSFTMGSDKFYPDEKPIRDVSIQSFRIDPFEVTRERFAEFVDQTGYVTTAERQPDPSLHPNIPESNLEPGGAVFLMEMSEQTFGRWAFVSGANWRKPEGKRTTNSSSGNLPVTQVSYEDARAFARWVGGDLPTEAQWEYAARAGHIGRDYEWGDIEPDDLDIPRANTWQGLFPLTNKANDGFYAAAQVGCYQANDYGLFDMTGNVWEWVQDADPDRNIGVIKGGSFLCAKNFCRRYRPAARHAQELDFSTNHIGFRVAYPSN